MRVSAPFPLLLACSLSALIGCGGSSETPEVLAPVSGAVLIDGQPLSGVLVSFVAINDTVGTGAYGVTDDAGKFTLTHQSGEPGIEPGQYQINFSRMTMPNGEPVPPDQSAADVNAEEMIPAKYNTPGPNMLYEEIPPEGKEGLEFKIETGKK